jgi:hypothetical protein
VGITDGGPSQDSDEEEWSVKTKIGSLIAVAALILAFALIVPSPAAPNPAGGKAVPVATSQPSTTTADPAAERHPQIREALGAMRRAKEHLEHAAHDFGGHRVDALRATDEAIRQLEICLKYDKD